ncbi:MAG: hypothetical protein JWM40_2946 [Frankiales bacterium]|nr:hypothetical protein [Frankiales bacterium]
MTDARIVSSPPEGSGFTHGLLDELYDKRQTGKHIDFIPVMGLLKVSGHGEQDTAKGTRRHVKVEFVRLEPVRDAGDAENVTWQITREYENRTTPGSAQTELPLSNSPDEKKRSLREELAEWASDNGKSDDELDAMFVDMLGGPGHAVATCVANASLVHLIEFVGWVTADSKQQTIVPGPEFSDVKQDDKDPDEDAA